MTQIYDIETQKPLSGPDAARAVLEGRAAVSGDAEIVLRDNAGNRVSLSQDQLDANLARMVQQGYSIETPEETARTESVLSARSAPVQAGAEAIARGATLGLTDFAGAQLSPEYAQGAALRRQQLGGIATGLELVGAVAPAFASGGSTLGATPAGLLARGAEAAGSALEQSLVARGVGAGAARIAGLAAGGALDGAVSNVGQELSEDSLGGIEITAESLAAAGGLGALLGLAGGAGAGALSRKSATGVTERIAARRAAEVEERLGNGATDAGLFQHVPDALIDRWSKIGSAASGAEESSVRAAFRDKSVRADWLNQQQFSERTNKEIRDALQNTLDEQHLFRDIAAGELKAASVAREVPTGAGAGAAAFDVAAPVLTEYRNAIAAATRDAPGVAKSLGKELDVIERDILNSFSEGKMADGYILLDQWKRSLQKNVLNAKGGGGKFVDARTNNELKGVFEATQQRLRGVLENQDVFGEAGRKQAERNASLSKMLDTAEGFDRSLTTTTGERLNSDEWWLKKRIVDGDKAASFIASMANPNREYSQALVRRHLESLADVYSTLERNGEIPAAKLADLQRAKAGVEKAIQVFDGASKRVQTIADINAMSRAQSETAGLFSSGTGALVGSLVGGGPGAAVGAAAGGIARFVTNPTPILRQVAVMEAISQRSGAVKRSVAEEVRGAIQTLAKPKVQRKELAAARASTKLFGSDQRDQADGARRVEQRINELRRDPMRLVDALGHQAATIAPVAPRVTEALAITATRALSFLESKLPPPSSMPNRLQPGASKTYWTAEQADKMSRYVAAIKDPRSVIKDMRAGRLDRESVEAVRAVYPELYSEMRETAIEEVAKHSEEMPYDSVIQLSLLLGFAGHPTLSPQFISASQSAWQVDQQQAQQAAPSPSNVKPIQFQTTYTEQLSQGLSAR
jgi:hypothetical protein